MSYCNLRREIQYVKRYGYSLIIILIRTKAPISKAKLEGLEPLNAATYWTDILNKLGEEASLYEEELDRGNTHGHVKQIVTSAVFYTCFHLGICRELAVRSIKKYDKRAL